VSRLVIRGLAARVGRQEILRGVDLEVGSGEVHALMGPNGSGKSTLAHVLAGRPGYEVTAGSVAVDGLALLGLPTWRRAQAGLLLTHQYPVEVPGVRLVDLLEAALAAREVPAGALDRLEEQVAAEAERLGMPVELLDRGVNVEFSGGEQKRAETLQLAVLRPAFAVLDEIDSGLDVDALRTVGSRIGALVAETALGVLAITHYARLLSVLRPDRVHVLLAGRVVRSGGAELAEEVERVGYEGLAAELGVELAVPPPPPERDPFADPGF
jgi:Fe-S cluster assembly ATP-binding protein